MSPPLSRPQERMLEVLGRLSREEGRWVNWWDAAQEWGSAMPGQFVHLAASKCFQALEMRDLVEPCLGSEGLYRVARRGA